MVHVLFSKAALGSCSVVLRDHDTLIFMYEGCQDDLKATSAKINKNVEIYSMQNDEKLIQAFFDKITQKELQIRSWY